MIFIVRLIANVTIFIALRYLSLFVGFLAGLGASDHSTYESYIYLPGTLVQILILLILFSRERGKPYWFQFIIIALLISTLSVAGFMNIIPYSVIPY